MSDHHTPNEQRSAGNGQAGFARRVLATWHRLNDWLKALLLAMLVLGFVHVFVLRWVTVRSTSMYGTLLPGDVIGVTRWNTWTGFARGDIAVFRDPLQDDKAMSRRALLVKRIVGLPGDVVELRDGELLVNNEPVPDFPQQTRSWLVRLKKGADGRQLLHDLGLWPAEVPSDSREMELPLNKEMAAAVRARPEVVSVEPMRLATGAPRHIFPYSPFYKWNGDDYGPIIVPRNGDHVRVNAHTLPLHDRVISHYEGNRIENAGNAVLINGTVTDTYLIRQNYYFVLGDSRHYSADSRYWGFVPEDHLLGRVGFVLLSSAPEDGAVRRDRWFHDLH